jgi:large subunit ribosomal protein L33
MAIRRLLARYRGILVEPRASRRYCRGRSPFPITRIAAMAKSGALIIKMLSTADTGFYYVTKKNPRGVKTEKLALKKYDPIARKHVVFKEGKIK